MDRDGFASKDSMEVAWGLIRAIDNTAGKAEVDVLRCLTQKEIDQLILVLQNEVRNKYEVN